MHTQRRLAHLIGAQDSRRLARLAYSCLVRSGRLSVTLKENRSAATVALIFDVPACSQSDATEGGARLRIRQTTFAVNLRIDVSSVVRRASQAFLQLEDASGGIRTSHHEHILNTCIDFLKSSRCAAR
jgi:hypothetical protein